MTAELYIPTDKQNQQLSHLNTICRTKNHNMEAAGTFWSFSSAFFVEVGNKKKPITIKWERSYTYWLFRELSTLHVTFQEQENYKGQFRSKHLWARIHNGPKDQIWQESNRKEVGPALEK